MKKFEDKALSLESLDKVAGGSLTEINEIRDAMIENKAFGYPTGTRRAFVEYEELLMKKLGIGIKADTAYLFSDGDPNVYVGPRDPNCRPAGGANWKLTDWAFLTHEEVMNRIRAYKG